MNASAIVQELLGRPAGLLLESSPVFAEEIGQIVDKFMRKSYPNEDYMDFEFHLEHIAVITQAIRAAASRVCNDQALVDWLVNVCHEYAVLTMCSLADVGPDGIFPLEAEVAEHDRLFAKFGIPKGQPWTNKPLTWLKKPFDKLYADTAEAQFWSKERAKLGKFRTIYADPHERFCKAKWDYRYEDYDYVD